MPKAENGISMMAEKDWDRRNWIAGLDKGLSIIQAFDLEHPQLTAAAVAKLTDMSRSAARRHLMTLTYLGFTATDGKQFGLTPKALKLGMAYLHSARLPRLAQPYLQRLTSLTREISFLSVLDDEELIFIARNGGGLTAASGFVLGARVSPFVAAGGFSILSSFNRERIEYMLNHYEVKQHTPYTITDKQVLLEKIQHSAQLGYAVSERQMDPLIRGVAVPLKNHKAETLGALSVSVRIGDEDTEAAVSRLLPSLQAVASEMREVL